MSLVLGLTEITRNCFQSGILPEKWLALCKQFVEEVAMSEGQEQVANGLCNSVLLLYRSYPAAPILNKYLTHSLEDGTIPLHVYVSAFLQASCSPELHSPPTLHFLCELALKTHDESGHLPLGSLVSPTAPFMSNLATAEDALSLVQIAQNMSLNQRHSSLILDSQRLACYLLSCVTDVFQIPTTAQIYQTHSRVLSVLQTCHLVPELRNPLNSFEVSLQLLNIQDEPGKARDVYVGHAMDSTVKPYTNTSKSEKDSDVLSLGLLWQYLVRNRAHEFGAGNKDIAAALLVSTWRWCAWPPNVFYAQLFLSLFTCLASCPAIGDPLLWRCFVVARVPELLAAFYVQAGKADPSLDLHLALQQGLKAAVGRRRDLIASGDHSISRAEESSNGNLNNSRPNSYVYDFLRQLVKNGQLDLSAAMELDPMLANAQINDPANEAFEFQSDFEAKLGQDMTSDQAVEWLHPIWSDSSKHNLFGRLVLKRFETSANGSDVEPLSRLCRALYTHHRTLDMVSLHVKAEDLMFYSLSFLEGYDYETVGDPQTAVSHVGDVVLFLQYILVRYQFNQDEFSKDGKMLSASFLRHPAEVIHFEMTQTPESAAFHSWFKALFDSSSEGIDDSILRSTHPKLLLRISPTLVLQAVKAVTSGKIDIDILMNGVSYFTGPLLNWTLVGVVKALISEIRLYRNPPSVALDVLQALITSQTCPQQVLALVSTQFLQYSSQFATSPSANTPAFNGISSIEALVKNASNPPAEFGTRPNVGSWSVYPQAQLAAVATMARSGRISELDVDRCLKVVHPMTFIDNVWTQALQLWKISQHDQCRRLTTFIFATPWSTVALLPLFLHVYLPSALRRADKASAAKSSDKQSPDLEKSSDDLMAQFDCIASVVNSSLMAAFHLEWAMSTLPNDFRAAMGASSAAMARRLASDLRTNPSSLASQAILKRLADLPTFVASFPYFAPDVVHQASE